LKCVLCSLRREFGRFFNLDDEPNESKKIGLFKYTKSDKTTEMIK